MGGTSSNVISSDSLTVPVYGKQLQYNIFSWRVVSVNRVAVETLDWFAIYPSA